MTPTNQAFIKAYRGDEAAVGPPPARRMPSKVDSRTDTGPSPHTDMGDLSTSVQIIAPAASIGPFTTHTTLKTAERSAASPGISQGKRPLSSFSTESSTNGPRSIREPLAHGSTVKTFRMPAICQPLRQQCGPQYDRIARLLVRHANEGRSLVGVASLQAGQGCTSTLLCLSGYLAALGKQLILVDANFTSPQLAQQLEVSPSVTWQDALERGLPVQDAVIQSEQDGMALLPLAPGNTPDHLLAGGLQASVTAGVLRYAYDMVLVDLGALLDPRQQAVTQQVIQNMRLDAALLVTSPKECQSHEMATISQLFDPSGCQLLGAIEVDC